MECHKGFERCFFEAGKLALVRSKKVKFYATTDFCKAKLAKAATACTPPLDVIDFVRFEKKTSETVVFPNL